jgi:hypothetical protein
MNECRWCGNAFSFGKSTFPYCSDKCRYEKENLSKQNQVEKKVQRHEYVEKKGENNEPSKPLGFFGWIFIIIVVILFLMEISKN